MKQLMVHIRFAKDYLADELNYGPFMMIDIMLEALRGIKGRNSSVYSDGKNHWPWKSFNRFASPVYRCCGVLFLTPMAMALRVPITTTNCRARVIPV